MTKINFQNLPSTTTPINATNLNQLQTNTENAINAVDVKNDCLYCNIDENFETTTVYTDVTKWNLYHNVGNTFSVNNGIIKVNAACKVKVTVKIYAYNDNTSNNMLYQYIRKNSSNIGDSWCVVTVAGHSYNPTYTQSVFDVVANDIITVALYGDNFNITGAYSTIIIERLT